MNPYLLGGGGGDTRLQQLEKTDRNPIEETEYQKLKSQADANDPVKQMQAKIDAQNAANRAANDARFASNKADITDFNTRYGAAVPQILNDTSNKYQLGTLLGNANALNTRVKDLQGNVSGVGAGGFANAGQVDKAIQTNYLPAYQTATENLQRGTTLAQNEESMLFKPFEVESSLLNDRLSRESTGYTAEQEKELDSLISIMNAGVQLTQAQIQQATALALRESEYKQAVETAKLGQTTDNSKRYITLGDGTQLYDTQTGKIIASNVKDFKAGGGGAVETFK